MSPTLTPRSQFVLDSQRKGLYFSRMNPSRSKQAFLRQLAPDALLEIFDLLPDVSFFVKDRKCRFAALNRRGCDYCGVRTEREALGRTDEDFFPRSRAMEYMADDRAVMKSGQPILNRIEPAPEMAGSARLVVTSKIPLHDAHGRVIGVAGFTRQLNQTGSRKGSTSRLTHALDHLHENHSEPVATGTLAKLAGLSRSQFDRTFRHAIGTTPRKYLNRTRIDAACRQLADTDETVASIAQNHGFYDHAHFTRCFRDLMGTTPSAYRRERRLR